MKAWFATSAAVVALNGATAQLLSPESVQGTLLGTFIGGAVGADHHHGWSGKGAAIGAGVGLVIGTIVGESHRQRYSTALYACPLRAYGYDHGYYSAPTYNDSLPRPNYAVSGTLWGTASGALIGQGANGKPGEGAVIGAAAGLVLGSISEHRARRGEAVQAAATATDRRTNPATYSATCSSVWQPVPAMPRHQIPDAPRVADAPTF